MRVADKVACFGHTNEKTAKEGYDAVAVAFGMASVSAERGGRAVRFA